MHQESTAVIVTMRSNRVQRCILKEDFKKMTKIPRISEFFREINIFEGKTTPNNYLQL